MHTEYDQHCSFLIPNITIFVHVRVYIIRLANKFTLRRETHLSKPQQKYHHIIHLTEMFWMNFILEGICNSSPNFGGSSLAIIYTDVDDKCGLLYMVIINALSFNIATFIVFSTYFRMALRFLLNRNTGGLHLRYSADNRLSRRLNGSSLIFWHYKKSSDKNIWD